MTHTSSSESPPADRSAAASTDRDALLAHAKTLGEIATELGLCSLADTIAADTRRRLDDQRVRAVVLGEIKQGKSTLINAILGDNALPTGVTPTTGAVATVRVGDAPGMYLHEAEGRQSVAAERFAALATGKERADDGSSLELVVGEGALPPSLELIDTPGMNDMERVRGAISRGELPRADVLVLVLDATQLLNRTELAFLRDAVAAVGGLASSGASLLLAINRIDLVEASERPTLVEYLRREIDAIGGAVRADALEIFTTDARGALRRPEAQDEAGIAGVFALRKRLCSIADGHAEILPARARAALARHATLLAHNAAIAARALTLEELALRREIRKIEREMVEQQSDLVAVRTQLAEGKAKIVADSNEQIDRFATDLRASTLSCIDQASLRVLSSHLPGSLHDAFYAFGREHGERLRAELDELTRKAIITHGEQARRRLFQATLRLGFRGAPIYIDPPSVVLEAGLVAVGLAGTAVMYFGSMVAGLAMTVAGPLATVFLREKSLRDARARAKEALPQALSRSTEALRDSIVRVVDQHVAAVEEHLVLANVALGKQLVDVLEQARDKLGPDDGEGAPLRREQAQRRMLELERTLYDMRRELSPS